jgi:replicative DNA helicase
MYEEDVIERLFCMSQKIDNYELLKGNFDLYQKEWNQFEVMLDGIPLVITDMLGKTWQEVDAYLTNLTTKPKVIFIDHLQEARSQSSTDQKHVIEEYLKKIRVMAIRENIAIVICSQINRSSQDEKVGTEPQLHHLKQSGYIEEGADFIILLHWQWHYTKKGDKNKFVLNVAKNRNGRTGWIDIKYKPENYFFYEKEEEITKDQGWAE